MTGLSGTGPAYPALLAVALIRDAVAHGLPPEVARRAVTALLVGTGRLLEKNGENPEDTVAAFVDYRGVTAAGDRGDARRRLRRRGLGRPRRGPGKVARPAPPRIGVGEGQRPAARSRAARSRMARTWGAKERQTVR